MPDCVVVDATDDDINHVIAHLRREHVREIFDQANLVPEAGVRLSVADSCRVFAGRISGRAVFLCGASRKSLLADIGSVWMVATAEIDSHPFPVIAALRELFSQAHDLTGAPVLQQFVPGWYRKGIKWLIWLGWTALDTRIINGVPHVHLVHGEASA